MQQDDLARLFSAQLSLSQPDANQTDHTAESDPASSTPVNNTEQKPAPIIYASQHYTHSHHIVSVRQRDVEPRRTHLEAYELGALLLRNSIDPSLLFPSQVDLFQQADDDQRLRLLELWRISPPQGRQGYPEGVDYNSSRQLYDWPPTSLAQEEAVARLRYDRMVQNQIEQENIRQHQEQLDQSMEGASAAVEATQSYAATSPERTAEPYITSGYDMLAQREYEASARGATNPLQESTRYNQATDPVYNGGLWQKDVQGVLDMENQYGAFAHARDHDVRPIYVDDEMVL